MVLSDRNILRRIENGSIVVDPFEEENIEPASLDLRLGNDFKVVEEDFMGRVDVGADTIDGLSYEEVEEQIMVYPEQFVLATTKEKISLPSDVVAEVLGRSSLGRLGISVHQTAGFIDPGFEGQITLEISNHGPAPVTLREGARICQIVFSKLLSPAMEPYGHEGSQYQNQSGATPSGMNFE
jgi:dCTP deaminase